MSITIQLKIKAPPEVVYEAITTTKGYKGWWADVCDINCMEGSISVIRFLKPDFVEEMCFKTVETKKDEKLIWQCISNNVFESWVGTTITFLIKPDDNNSILAFSQHSRDKKWKDLLEFEDSKAGWIFFMDSLKAFCETGKGSPWK